MTTTTGLLNGSRCYLSGPMDFVASRAVEKTTGWRNRIGQILRSYGVTVFDPWNKPEVRGMYEYGKEGEAKTNQRAEWTFEPYEKDPDAPRKRAEVAEAFWPALHIDLRMVDTSDFIVCYCPTNVYSVGTPHEIILARQQRKPVLFVSPYVEFPALKALREFIGDKEPGKRLLDELVASVPIRENLNASPSMWYMPLIGGEHFFDGFGFLLGDHRDPSWQPIALDDNEKRHPPKKPLLPFLAQLNKEVPRKWNRVKREMGPNDDWLLWDLERHGDRVEDVKPASAAAQRGGHK